MDAEPVHLERFGLAKPRAVINAFEERTRSDSPSHAEEAGSVTESAAWSSGRLCPGARRPRQKET